MQLAIDIGNTQIKSFLFKEDTHLETFSDQLKNWKTQLGQIIRDYPQINEVIISDVNTTFSEALKTLLLNFKVLHCSTDLILPFQTRYKPKNKLGADRIALLASCCLHYPGQEVLVIDLGSCITYDYLDAKAVHHGGAISPGFEMRYRGMHEFSGTLPALNFEQAKQPTAVSTQEAMHAGVYFGIVHEIEGIIDYYTKKKKNLTVILTGGAAERLPKPFKNGIFAHSNFLAEGLNYLLALNQYS